MSNLCRLNPSAYNRLGLCLLRRSISTSKSNRETTTAAVQEAAACPAADAKPATTRNWVSYGFDVADETSDRRAAHGAFFGAVTLCLIFGGFGWMYKPDYNLRDWAQREAYLEVRRRERDGLALVNRDVVDPSKIQLPTDDELGDTEIII